MPNKLIDWGFDAYDTKVHTKIERVSGSQGKRAAGEKLGHGVEKVRAQHRKFALWKREQARERRAQYVG
jgi:hypothetical protein